MEIDIEDSGKVSISGTDYGLLEHARVMVESLTSEVEVGKIYKGKVVKIMAFGAFVEVLPGKDGLVHVSQLADRHIKNVEDIVKEGDEVTVKVMEIDKQGRVNLTMKKSLVK